MSKYMEYTVWSIERSTAGKKDRMQGGARVYNLNSRMREGYSEKNWKQVIWERTFQVENNLEARGCHVPGVEREKRRVRSGSSQGPGCLCSCSSLFWPLQPSELGKRGLCSGFPLPIPRPISKESRGLEGFAPSEHMLPPEGIYGLRYPCPAWVLLSGLSLRENCAPEVLPGNPRAFAVAVPGAWKCMSWIVHTAANEVHRGK